MQNEQGLENDHLDPEAAWEIDQQRFENFIQIDASFEEMLQAINNRPDELSVRVDPSAPINLRSMEVRYNNERISRNGRPSSFLIYESNNTGYLYISEQEDACLMELLLYETYSEVA